MINREVEKTLSNLGLQRPAQRDYIPAVLGVSFNSTKFVDVPNRAGYVYARIRGNLSEVVQVFNDVVTPAYGLQVLITRDDVVKSRYKVIARDFGAYPNGWGTTSPYYTPHATSHSFNPDDPGGDIVWIYPQQFLPLLGYPGTTGTVSIYPYSYEYGGNWYYVGNTGTSTLLVYNPTGTATNRAALVYLGYDGNPKVIGGQEFPASYTGTVQVLPYLPSLPDDGLYPIAGVRLAPGTTSIAWGNLYDVRPFFDIPSTTGSSSSTTSGFSYATGTTVWTTSDYDLSSTWDTYNVIWADCASNDILITLPDTNVVDFGYRLWVHHRDSDGGTNSIGDLAGGRLVLDTQDTSGIDGVNRYLRLKNQGSVCLVFDKSSSQSFWKIESLSREEQVGEEVWITSATGTTATEPASNGNYVWFSNSTEDVWNKILEFASAGSTTIYPGMFDIVLNLVGSGAGTTVQSIKVKLVDGSGNLISESNEVTAFGSTQNLYKHLQAPIYSEYNGTVRIEIWAKTVIYGSGSLMYLYWGVAGKKSRFYYPVKDRFTDDFQETYPLIMDGGSYKGFGKTLEFDDTMTVSVTGSTAFIGSSGVPGPPGPQGSNTIIYDDGVLIVSGSAISFDAGLSVVSTGTTAFVFSDSVVATYSMNTGTIISLLNNSTGTINYDYKWYDTHNSVTTGADWKFTAPKNGYYHVNATFLFDSTSTWTGGEQGNLQLYKNNTPMFYLDRKDHYSTSDPYMQLSGGCDIYLDIGDTIHLIVSQNSGGTLTNYSGSRLFNYVSIHKIN